ncbi:phosphofructokinase [Gonapodya prolifera JEL478]|uniref:Phosphofructokinase n=1 Tax=Gonapodya prolifera (strain JEL478) TaxID=1344416 RepID=A0A139ABG4_GONPJ|nr:phosphofructokinase [Gonapodya prolifera JEL478]|eukprot:KXS13984.1 phosphofructokinase [Gonapodya prolifera JEL478]
MIGISHNEITKVPPQEAVALTMAGADAIKKKDFGRLVDTALKEKDDLKSTSVAAVHKLPSAPAKDNFPGLLEGKIRALRWEEVHDWATIGGSKLGASQDHPSLAELHGRGSNSRRRAMDALAIKNAIKQQRLDGLMIVGGFEGFAASAALKTVDVATRRTGLMQSAGSNPRRVFVVRVMYGESGYLATTSGLAAGAMTAFTPVHEPSLRTLYSDVTFLSSMQGRALRDLAYFGATALPIDLHVRYIRERSLTQPQAGRLIIRNEKAGGTAFTTQSVASILNREGQGLFDVRVAVLGHLQHG